MKGDKWMHFDVLNPNIVVPCPNLTVCLRNPAIRLVLQVERGITRVSKVVMGP